jgi:chorismate dehydratase
VMLTRMILAKRYGSKPEVIPMAPDLNAMLARADAALIIGDPALLLDPEKLPYHCLDLGEEWVGMTGFPMVFAVWAGRPEVLTPDVAEAFAASAAAGVAALDRIAAEQAPVRGLTEELTRRYLTLNTAFILDESDYHGMKLFLKYVAEMES